MRLYSRLRENGTTDAVDIAHSKLRDLALPHGYGFRRFARARLRLPTTTKIWTETSGLMRLRFPALRRQVKEVRDLALNIASPLLENDAQITFLIDGLDRLIQAERFREFAEQDLRALRGTKITVIVVAPLLLLYDKSRFLQDYFDSSEDRIPAAGTGPADKAFLRQILERRGALDLMNRSEVSSIVKFSGGVIRDLLTLASSAAAYAYREDQDRTAPARPRGCSTTRQTLPHRTRKDAQKAAAAVS